MGIWSILGGGIVKSAGKVLGMVIGDKAAREQGEHDEAMAVYKSFAAEFQIQTKTWFDSLINGLNRLPRPLAALGVLGFLLLAYLDPIQFQIVAVSLDAVPDLVWGLIMLVFGFYFGGRMQKVSGSLAMNKEAFAVMMSRVEELKKSREDDKLSKDPGQS